MHSIPHDIIIFPKKNQSKVNKIEEFTNRKVKKSNTNQIVLCSFLNYLILPEIRSITNFGLSSDPGIDEAFCFFYHRNLENAFSSVDYLNKFNYNVLFSSSFYRLDHRNQLKILLEIFPPEMTSQIKQMMQFIDHGY